MKRNQRLVLLLLLFILLGCTPDDLANQATTATTGKAEIVQPTTPPIPTPIPTVENEEVKIIGIEEMEKILEGNEYPTELTKIAIEDILSGKLQEAEIKWIEENPFSPEAKPVDLVKHSHKITILTYPGTKTKEVTVNSIAFETDPNLDYQNNPELRPFKIISFYNFWDDEIYNDSGFFNDFLNEYPDFQDQIQEVIDAKGTNFSVVSWALLTTDGVFIGYSISSTASIREYFDYVFQRVSYKPDGQQIKMPDTKMRLVYNVEQGDYLNNMISQFAMINYIWKTHPELSPEKYIDQTTKTSIPPDELRKTLFTFEWHVNDPW